MTPERYQQLKRVFQEVCRLESPQRAAYLDRVCAGDSELRSEVEALLSHDEKSLPVRPGVTAAAAFDREHLDAGAAEGSSAWAGFSSAKEQIPSRIGHYRVIRKVGQGGMGVVFQAEQNNPRRTIALKVIRPGVVSDQVLRRFKFEAHVLGRLQHPGIAQVYEAGTAEIETRGGLAVEQPFFAMEYIHGKPLSDLVEQQGLGTRQRLALFTKICDAVQHAHQKGVIHRDLKPSNILVDESGQPKILDFGVARVTEADVQVTTLQTDVGQLVGTLPYMSPEQVAGKSQELDTRSDVYALGVICYQLLTGQLPYEVRGKTIPEAARTITEQQPKPLSSLNRIFRGDLQTIVAKSLEKEKDRRYQSASDLAADIRRYLSNQPISARPVTTLYQLRMLAQRNRMLVASLIGIVLALIGGTVVSTTLAIRAFNAEELAKQRFDLAEDARELAEQKRAEATEALARATTETARATAFRDFLVGMLKHVNPDAAQGRDVTLLREVLDEAAAKIETELVEFPDVQASIHQVIGTVYRNISSYDVADQHFQAAYDLRASHLGDDHIDTLASLRGLAQVRWDQNRLDEAESIYSALVARYRELVGDADRTTLLARYDLAGIAKEQGRLDEAEQALRQILDDMRTHLGDQDDAVYEAMNGLVVLAIRHGEIDAETEILARAVVDRWTEIHGPRHPKRLTALQNLAVLVKERGNLGEAEELTRESYQLQREVFGEAHHQTIQSMINLASLLAERGKFIEAEPLAREALEQATTVLGPEHRDTIKALSHLGIIARQLEKYDEAREYLEEAVALSEKVHGPHDTLTLSRLSSLAGLLYVRDELADAEVIMRRVVAGHRAAHGEHSSQTVSTMNNLGLLLVKRGKLDEAEETLLEAIRLTDNAAPPGHWYRWNSRLSFCQCLVAMERFEQAEQLLLECHAGLEEIFGPAHYRTRGAADLLVKLYETWGRPDEAAKYVETPATQPAETNSKAP